MPHSWKNKSHFVRNDIGVIDDHAPLCCYFENSMKANAVDPPRNAERTLVDFRLGIVRENRRGLGLPARTTPWSMYSQVSLSDKLENSTQWRIL
jgi:hypothetical protein